MNTENTAMNGDSLDIARQKRQELEQLFPGIFTETRNDKGELVKTVDVERLKAELGDYSEIYDNRRERYGMDWPGKKDCLRLIQEPSHATLNPCREESVDFDSTENLFIEGDNLEVLKLLQKSYYGQVKMIYIDPPYNTGKEFIYPDNFSENLDTYLEYAGLKESGGEGRKWSTNSQNEGRFHTKWLNMMFPRLYLARNLLREDGVIFISIDDNEVENLRRMCDEIFGEENFVAQICWQKKYAPSNDATDISPSHDFVIAYLKSRTVNENGRTSATFNRLERDDSMNKPYKNPDDDMRGEWRADNYLCNKSADERPNLYYPITNPYTGKIIWPKRTAVWRYSKEQHERNVAENRVWWGRDGASEVPAFKRFLTDVGGKMATTWWPFSEVGHNDEAKKEIQKLFPDTDRNFDTPKPTRLIRRMIELATQDGDIVLDFFAGASTTAHAAMLHSSEKNPLQYIMVQLPEPIEDKQYRTIADISKARIRRAAQQILESNTTQLDFGNGSFDSGFKVLKLNQSNFKQWQAPDKQISDESLVKQMELNVDPVDPNTPQEFLLYELLIKAGVKPTERIEKIDLAGRFAYRVGEDSLLVYLDKEISEAQIEAAIRINPEQFICLDTAFHGNDQLKTNAVKRFESYNEGKQGLDRIDFKTV